jgi:hypothetical protein
MSRSSRPLKRKKPPAGECAEAEETSRKNDDEFTASGLRAAPPVVSVPDPARSPSNTTDCYSVDLASILTGGQKKAVRAQEADRSTTSQKSARDCFS